jgi:hypothetical protein
MSTRPLSPAATLFAILMALSPTACKMPIEASGSVALEIVAPSPAARTILPQVVASSYRISFSGPAAVADVETASTSVSCALTNGTWTISVSALDAGKAIIATGSASGVVISGGATTSVSIRLTTSSTGTGWIDLTVIWPAEIDPQVQSVGVWMNGMAEPGGTVVLDPVGHSARYRSAKPAGDYLIRIDLVRQSDQISINEAIRVLGNITTGPGSPIVLSQSDFTSAPASPSGLVASEGLSRISLSWVDNSFVEDGFIVEFRTGAGAWAQLADLPANSQSFVHSTAASDMAFSYRVRAYNSAGSSAYCAEASGSWAPPTLGSLSFGAATTNSIAVTWPMASDDHTLPANIQYRLLRSAANNIGTLESAAANGTIVMDWTAGATGVTAGGLSAGSTYWFALLARDAATNAGISAVASSATLRIYAISYSANGGTGAPTDPSSPYASGSTVTVLGPGAMTWAGHAFTGWYSTPSGTGGSAYSPGSTFSIAADVQLYAQWIVLAAIRIIDHSNFDPDSLPLVDITKAAALKVYFEHASVGQNISDDPPYAMGGDTLPSGLSALKALNPRYSSGRASWVSDPYAANSSDPAWFDTHTGLGDNFRGNPAADYKRSYFAASMGTIAAKVNVASFKLCWIDNPSSPSTLFNSVKTTMEALEAAYPGVKFVWWTMPITTLGYGDSASIRGQRQSFNTLVRNYCNASGKWLLDIADLESHDDLGNALVDGSGNELLYPSYATDGGHLSASGRLKVAKAYWRLLAEIAR